MGGLLQAVVISRKARPRIDVVSVLPPTGGDAVQLQQVLLNLIVNALDAVIEYPTADREVAVRAVPYAMWGVEMSVIDQGSGFGKQMLSRLLEPFFSTKKHGIGIGLRLCRKIIEAHGDQLTFVNNADHGAAVSFTLPRSRDEEEKRA